MRPIVTEQTTQAQAETEQMKRAMLANHADEINSAATSPRNAHKQFRWKKGDMIGEGAYAKVF